MYVGSGFVCVYECFPAVCTCVNMHLETVTVRVNSEDIDLNLKRQADFHVKLQMFSVLE